MVDENGRTLRVEVRQSDGYFNATLMCQSAGKKFPKYYTANSDLTKKTTAFLKRLSSKTQIGISDLVSSSHGGAHSGTWVHRKVAIHLAQWISPDFAIWVTDLVELFVSGKLTTEQSQAAEREVAAASVFTAPEKHAGVAFAVEWKEERGKARENTKGASAAIQAAGMERKPGYEVHMKYNDGANWAVTGKRTTVLRQELGLKRGMTPRDRMQPEQLAMVQYQAGMIKRKLEDACEGRAKGLQDSDILAVTSALQRKVHAMCKDTGAHTLQLLDAKPPPPERIVKAIEAERPSKRQKTLLNYMPKTVTAPLALPAPVPVEG